MPRLVHQVPKYRKHRSGQAFVSLNGKHHYLGPHGSAASRSKYDRLIAEHLSAGRQNAPPPATELTIAELIARYWRFVKQHYVKHGVPTAERICIKSALKIVRRLYGSTPAIQFGPVALKAVRQAMIDKLARTTINKQVGRIRRMFRWAASEEVLPVTVLQSLCTVPGLQRGRTTARETEPVCPVEDAVINATLPYLPPIVGDMVRFQLLTGCRPEEACMIRPCDVQTKGEVWEFVPPSHKTEHRGRTRIILVGPKAQNFLRPYLLRAKEAYCFSPRESERRRLRNRHEARVTPEHYGNRPGTNVRRKPLRAPNDRYVTSSYRRAIERACDKAFPPPTKLSATELKEWRREHRWTPNQLRHSAATALRKQFGLDVAQVVLGHSSAEVTQIYAERDLTKAAAAIREIG